MALIKCPECGKEISDKAVSCPNCGYMLKNKSLDSFDVKELRSKLLDARSIALVFVYLGILFGYAGSKVLGIETKSYSIIGYLKEEGPSIPAIILLIVPIAILLCIAFLGNISKIIYFAGAGCGLICVIALFISMGNALNPNSAPAISESPKLGFFLELLVWIFIATWTILKEYTNTVVLIKNKFIKQNNDFIVEGKKQEISESDNQISEIAYNSKVMKTDSIDNSIEIPKNIESEVVTNNERIELTQKLSGISGTVKKQMDLFDKIKATVKDVRLIALALVYIAAFFSFFHFYSYYALTEYTADSTLIDLFESILYDTFPKILFVLPIVILLGVIIFYGKIEKKYIYLLGSAIGIIIVLYIYFRTGEKVKVGYSYTAPNIEKFPRAGFVLEIIAWEFIIVWTVMKDFICHSSNEQKVKSSKKPVAITSVVIAVTIGIFCAIIIPPIVEQKDAKQERDDSFDDLYKQVMGQLSEISKEDEQLDNVDEAKSSWSDQYYQTLIGGTDNDKQQSQIDDEKTNEQTSNPKDNLSNNQSINSDINQSDNLTDNQSKQNNTESTTWYDYTEYTGDLYSFYGIWCGGSANKNETISYAQNLADLGLSSIILDSERWSNLAGNNMYVVTVGTFDTEKEANDCLPFVKQYIPNAFVAYSGTYTKYTGIGDIVINDNENSDDKNQNLIPAAYYDLTNVTEDIAPFYGVWCAVSKDKQEAVNAAKALVELGIEGDVLYSENWELFSGLNWYIVSAGRYSTESEANMVLSKVKQYYSEAYVARTGDYIDYQQSQEDVGNYTDEDYRIVNMIAYALTNELKENDLVGFTSFELSAIRNGIFAAHGNVFKTQEWNDYYSRFDWYIPNAAFSQDSLTSVENHNASLIREYEEKTYGTIYKFK